MTWIQPGQHTVGDTGETTDLDHTFVDLGLLIRTLTTQATVTSAGALVVNSVNPVDATAGVISMSLPNPTQTGQLLGVEKTDTSTHAVIITGIIRGVSTSVNLQLTNETVVFEAEATGNSWRPFAGHKTLSSLDARYQPSAVYATLPQGWNAGYKAALAAIASTPLVILANGDSVTGGYNTTTSDVRLALAWPSLLSAALQTKYGVGNYGDGYTPYEFSHSSDAAVAGSVTDENAPFGTLTAASYQVDNAIFGYAVESVLTTGTFQTITFTGTGFELVVASISPSATFTISVDGAALPGGATATGTGVSYSSPTITYTNHGTNSFVNTPVDKIIVAGLANTSHTVTIHNPSAVHGLILGWLNVYSGSTSGIMMCRNGLSGSMSVQQNGASATTGNPDFKGWTRFPTMPQNLWSGGVAGINGTNSVWLSSNPFGPPTGAQLIIDAHIINDAANPVALDAFRYSKQQKYENMRRARPGCSIVCLIPSMPNGTTSDANVNGSGFYENFKTVVYDVAKQFQCAVVDVDIAWGVNGVGLGYQIAGNFHPTTTGYASIAALLLAIL